MSTTKLTLLRIIAALQVIGGAIMVYVYFFIVIPHLLSQQKGDLFLDLLIVLVFLALSVISIWAGVLLWSQKKSGVRMSLVLQLLQIPCIQLGTFIYTLQASFLSLLATGTAAGVIEFTPGFGARGALYWGSGLTDAPAVGVNLVAILLFILLLWLGRSIKKE